MTGPWLTALWLLPALGAFAVMLLPAGASQTARRLGLAVSVGTLVIAILLASAFDTGGSRYQFIEDHPWIPSFGVRYSLGLDGIGLVLVMLTTALIPLLLLASFREVPVESTTSSPGLGSRSEGSTGSSPGLGFDRLNPTDTAAASSSPYSTTQKGHPTYSTTRGDKRVHTFIALFLAVEALVLLSVLSLDILLFYIVFEAMLIPMYFLIGGFGSGPDRARAAVKFLLYNLLGGLIMLAAVVGLYVVTARSEVGATFNLPAIAAAAANGDLAASDGVLRMLFLGFMFAFAVKAPLWPFHTWLPGAAVAATPTGAVLMMAVVDKVGTLAMLRFALPLFPEASQFFAPAIVALAVIGILYGAILAIGQTDLLRLIAYTSISHFGFIILGIFVFTPQGQAGATLYMLNHGISTAALFLIAGFLVARGGSRRIADYGGVARVAPVLAGTFLIAGLATLSLPGLAPFISEFLVLIGSYARYPVAAIFASFALVLAAIYILWTYQRVMAGPQRGLVTALPDGPGAMRASTSRIGDLLPVEVAVVAPMLLALLVIGIYPAPILDAIDPVVAQLLASMNIETPGPEVAP